METQRVCLDSDVLVDFKRGIGAAADKVRELEDAGARLFTTDINAFELYFGAYASRRRERNLAEAKRTLEALGRIEMDDRVAELSGRTLAALEDRGQVIDIRDLLIGCTALGNGCSILTGNIGHFERIPGLNTLQYHRGKTQPST